MDFFPLVFVLGKLAIGTIVGLGGRYLPFGSSFGEPQLLLVLRCVWLYDFISVLFIVFFGAYAPEETFQVVSLALTAIAGTTAFIWGVIWNYRELRDNPAVMLKLLVGISKT